MSIYGIVSGLIIVVTSLVGIFGVCLNKDTEDGIDLFDLFMVLCVVSALTLGFTAVNNVYEPARNSMSCACGTECACEDCDCCESCPGSPLLDLKIGD